MKNMPLIAVLTLSVASPFTVQAQFGNPAFMPVQTPESAPGKPAPHQTNPQDRLFIRNVAIGGSAEVESGQMALKKAASEPLKRFAKRMINEHTSANDKLAQLAKADGITLPQAFDPDHETMRQQLQQLDGMAFDRQYLLNQIIDHQNMAQLLEWEIGSGLNSELKSYAMQNLPIVLDHLQAAQELQAQLTGASVR